MASFFSAARGCFFKKNPMLTHKTFETNSLKQTFVLDERFDRDCVCFNIERLSNIDEMLIL